MVLITRFGVRTCLGWWTRVSVAGRTVVLTDTSDELEPKLVVAEEASVEEARRLLVVIEDRIRLRARRFDCRSWNARGGVDPSSPEGWSAGERNEA